MEATVWEGGAVSADRRKPRRRSLTPITASPIAPEFRHEALRQRHAFGLVDLVPVVIDHPLSTLSDAKSDRRVEWAIPQCLRIRLGSWRDCY
jgi:hypothetical protein